jgi:nucleotide-binding universal stress UspA family protein
MKILLAFDGSNFSEAAVRAITSQMRLEGAEVLVVQVVEPRIFSTPPEMSPGYAPEQEEVLEEQLKEAEKSAGHAAEALKAAGYKARTRVVEGETRSGILDVAAEWRADLIVLGSHGRKGLQRFLLGSVAESVARNAFCSVLIVRAPSKS